MAEIKITDLVDPEAIKKLHELDVELTAVLTTYTNVAKDLAKGINIEVKVAGDIDKLEKLLVEKGKEAAQIQEKLTNILQQQSQVVANTSNTISRQLMEQERVNKATRQAYTEQEKVKKLLEQYHDTYENQIESLVKINNQLEANKKQHKENQKALNLGKMSAREYAKAEAELTASNRDLMQQKRALNSIMTAEEKANLSAEGSYAHMSQQLELLKKAYKDLGEEGRSSDFGKELETSIQNLDAHLKDLAADMGEFQRNVGNYSIAGQNGVVSTESLVAVLNKQAVTTKDVADQSKILMEARSMLDTSDANYSATIELINNKLSENSRRLSDVSDIMSKHATSVAEAEAQNQRLSEALKHVDLTSDDAAAKTSALNAKIEENNKIISENSASQTTLKKDLKELVLEIATLSIQYQSLSEEEQNSASGQALKSHINDLIERAGVLRDAISDTNAAITNAASDTRGFDRLGGVLQLTIDGFGLATGAAEILGISSEDLASIQTKLQAAIAASNAMQSIQNTLQKQSAVMQGVNLVQTKLRTTAENLHTAAQGKGTIATAALTAAQWAFNAAAKANPIGLLVVAITGCIATVYGLVKAFRAFFGNSDESLQKYQEQKQGLNDLGEENERLIENMKARGASETELLNQSLLNKQSEKDAADALFKQASELYDEDEDEYKAALDAKKKADKDFETQKENSLNYLLKVIHESEEEEKKQRLGTYEYKRQLIKAELEQQKALAATLLAQEKITKQVYENLVASLDKAAKMKIDAVNTDEKKDKESKKKSPSGSGKSRVSEARKSADELKKAVQAGEDALLKMIEDSHERQIATENLHYTRSLKELQTQLAKTKESQVKMRNAIHNQIEGLTAEHQRKLDELENTGIERRLKANADYISVHLSAVKEGSKEELEWKVKQIDNQTASEIQAITKSENEKLITTEQAEEMRSAIIEKYANQVQTLEDGYAANSAKVVEEKYAHEQAIADAAYIEKTARIKQRYAEEFAEANGNSAKIEAATKKMNKELLALNQDYAKQTMQSSIDMVEEVLKNDKLSTEDRQRYEEELAKKKAELEKQMAENAIDNINNTVEADNKAKEKRMANIQQWMQAASDALNSIGDLTSAITDAKISKIEEEQEANTTAGEEEQERIQELVDQKIITEEEGEARKRAAEAKTAQKNEELEKKKAKLKEKQAKYDKANSIAQCGIATALAIMRLWVNPGFPAAIPMAAVVGALGALQLATILATPLPKYAKGTDYHRGGPAIVGDGGVPEVITFGGKSWLTPDKPTLVDIPVGASVVPNVPGLNEADLTLLSPIQTRENNRPAAIYNDTRIIGRLDDLIGIERRKSTSKRKRDIESNITILDGKKV